MPVASVEDSLKPARVRFSRRPPPPSGTQVGRWSACSTPTESLLGPPAGLGSTRIDLTAEPPWPARGIRPPLAISACISSEMSGRRGSAPPRPGGARAGCGPESMPSRRWRGGLVRPSDPARASRDWLAGLAARAAPGSTTCGPPRQTFGPAVVMWSRPPGREAGGGPGNRLRFDPVRFRGPMPIGGPREHAPPRQNAAERGQERGRRRAGGARDGAGNAPSAGWRPAPRASTPLW
jgi:hypothetical protein